MENIPTVAPNSPVPSLDTRTNEIVSPSSLPDYSKDINTSLWFWLRITGICAPFIGYLLNSVISRVMGGYFYDDDASVITDLSRWLMILLSMLIYGVSIYVGVKQHLYISRVMKSGAANKILILNIVVLSMYVIAFIVGSIISMVQFDQSSVGITGILFITALSGITLFGTPTVTIPQFIYIQTNGRSRKWALTGKILGAIWVVLSGIFAIIVAWFVVLLSDPGTE